MRKLFFLIITLTSLGASAQTNTFFDQAFWKGNTDLASIKAAVSNGNNPTELNSNAMDAVVFAINNNASKETILYLLSQPGNGVNKITHDSRTYLFWAAARGNLPIMTHLLRNGAKTDLNDSHGYSPLTYAVVSGQKNLEVYNVLLERGMNLKTDLNHDGANALLIAIANDKDFVLTDYFTARGLDINSKDAEGNTAFNYAAKGGNIFLMNKLISKGVAYNDRAMIMAAQGGGRGSSPNTLEVFRYLEGLRIKPTALGSNGENALFYLVRKPNQGENIAYFISKGVDVNQADRDGNTAFMNAATYNSDLPTLELLSKQVKNLNQANGKGASALHLAAKGNTVEVMQFLINKGGSINLVDRSGDNVVAYMLQGYSPKAMGQFDAKLDLLKNMGFDFAKLQGKQNSLYHLAVAKNDLDLLRKLEALKIDVNLKNKEGYTALHRAAMTGRDESILKYLISIGARKDITTEFKESVYDLASENESLTKNKVSIDFLK